MGGESPTGRCMCGAITYDVDGPLRNILHCHCVNCRRVSGNFVASSGCATEDLTIHDDEGHLRWYDHGFCRYGFCSNCGSSIFWQGADHMNRTSLQSGSLLDDAEGLVLEGVWFVDEMQSHHAVPEGVPTHAGNGEAP